uniref:Metallo-beta-lactamase domain-containing protein n=1 Tax=Chromera velia CCMP2878 TaxID=1169474 RepID=A0A0G4I163_9ALVE|eukprot:Cvel_41.t1-p1 / transcript=Cvel_41.t1 / gene=Cvel_41 / organism=Chromera_velia_CCMP2878 / gene_product=Ribonuclease Z, putative / transcript_product=Ribonuclease Z, putative / location=Cvel_scaffold5:248911-251701(-) / protein_length=622 / sequence_SO=supercontig / SO=protein_coding / is_pseudo=false
MQEKPRRGRRPKSQNAEPEPVESAASGSGGSDTSLGLQDGKSLLETGSISTDSLVLPSQDLGVIAEHADTLGENLSQMQLRCLESHLESLGSLAGVKFAVQPVEITVDRQHELRGIPKGDMFLRFLGTASMQPSKHRGTSSALLKLQPGQKKSEYWLFDCGPGTQVRLQQEGFGMSPNRIFITHLHGDHCLGLAPLLCGLGRSESRKRQHRESPILIYGPPGLRNFLRTTIGTTNAKLTNEWAVYELDGMSMINDHKGISRRWMHNLPGFHPRQRGEVDVDPIGQQQLALKEGPPVTFWDLFEDEGFAVSAVSIQHTLPTVAFVLFEKSHAGRARDHFIRPLIERPENFSAFQKDPQIRDPRRIFRVLKKLKDDEAFTFPDGTIVRGRDVMEPPVAGRCVVFCQDTCDGAVLAPFVKWKASQIHGKQKGRSHCVDVLIHEATIANADFASKGEKAQEEEVSNPREECPDVPELEELGTDDELLSLGGQDSEGGSLPWRIRDYRTRPFDSLAYRRGHSTPAMAGAVARSLNARRLVLTHFSQRYKGDASLLSVLKMREVQKEAEQAFLHGGGASSRGFAASLAHGDTGPRVVTAWDGCEVQIPRMKVPPGTFEAEDEETGELA